MRKREREKEKEREKEGEREGGREAGREAERVDNILRINQKIRFQSKNCLFLSK